jgi:kynurenine--oxoglutarate transaminase/cysteine-S-conjugate beta-lyase/glutamine--phenylpyruvate transaminase
VSKKNPTEIHTSHHLTPPSQRPPKRLMQFGAPSVWLEFSPLAQCFKAINLGQGFPGWNPPEFVTEFAREMMGQGAYAQYARSAALPILAEKIASHYESRLGRKISWQDEVVVTVGCSEAILLAFLALVNPEDEVILLEPSFDIYRASLAMIGAKAVGVPLQFKDGVFNVDLGLIQKSITPRTKALVLNTPHNPTGKVFSADELVAIADILKDHPQVTVVSDEVYEHLVFDGKRHVSIASIPGMNHRTLALYSAGKTFSVTGWKIGWAIGPKELIQRLQICQQWVVFSVATPLQAAVAHCLDFARRPYKGEASYYEWLQKDYDAKRIKLFNHLERAGLKPLKPEGSFFITTPLTELPQHFSLRLPKGYQDLVDQKHISIDLDTLHHDDYNFCRSLTLSQQVTAIPYSAFFDPKQKKTLPPLARFAFCKPDEQIDEAGKRLAIRAHKDF